MNGAPISLCGQELTALPSGALWWADQRVLCVSDLHLGKSERMARRGGPLLPPYETRDTLARLTELVTELAPETVVSLGDSFDDLTAASSIRGQDRTMLEALMSDRAWIWVEGNHDAGPLPFGGTGLAAWQHNGLVFRHISDGQTIGELSGHFHPKARIGGRARACFLMDDTRLILPAFGTYTGGLYCDDAALAKLMQPRARAILTGATMATLPVRYG